MEFYSYKHTKREDFNVIKDFEKEVDRFEDNIKNVGSAVENLGNDGMKQLEKGMGYISDLPKLMLGLLNKALDEFWKIFFSILSDTIIIVLKILWIVIVNVWDVIEDSHPQAWILKYVALVLAINPFVPSIMIMKNFLALFMGHIQAFVVTGAIVAILVFYIANNYKEIVRFIGDFLGDIDYDKIIGHAVEETAEELYAIGKKIKDKMAEIF